MTAKAITTADSGRPGARAVFVTRRLYLGMGVLLLLAMGLVYSWSIFVPPLRAEFGWDASQTSLGFTILMSMFCLGGIAAGCLSRRRGPRLIILICAVLVSAGFFGASRLSSLAGLYFCFSGLVGLGVGMAYNVILSSVLKWFPDKQGFASGLLLMGFGSGSLILSTAGTSMLGSLGWRATFMALGSIYAVLIVASSFFIKVPGPEAVLPQAARQEGPAGAGLELTTGLMLKRFSFWLYFVWAVMLTAAGLMVIGSAASIANDLGADAALAGFLTGLVALCNGVGRVVAGILFDTVGRKVVLPLFSGCFILTGGLLWLAYGAGSLPLLIAGFVLTGFSYGGVPPSSSTVISGFYGLRNYPMNFSLVTTNIVFASFLGPALSGVMQTRSGSYGTTFAAIMIFGVMSLGLAFLIKKP